MSDPAPAELLGSYRTLLMDLLCHTWIDHEGNELAIADFVTSGNDGGEVLKELIRLQYRGHPDVEPSNLAPILLLGDAQKDGPP